MIVKFISKGNLASALVSKCQDKLTSLALDLSVRDNNHHVGSGLGGNSFQMFAMIGMDHHLTNRDVTIEVKDNSFIWGSKFLINNSLVSIRKVLDEAFLNLKEYNKLMSLMFLNPNNISETYSAYENNFPVLKDIFSGKQSVNFGNISLHQQIIIAFIISAKFANELDNNILTNLHTVGATIAQFDPEVILLAVRRYIGIDRIVKFNLDEHSVWGDVFSSLNKKVN